MERITRCVAIYTPQATVESQGNWSCHNIPGRQGVLKVDFSLLDTCSVSAHECPDTRLYIRYESLHFVHLEAQAHASVRVFTWHPSLTSVGQALKSEAHFTENRLAFLSQSIRAESPAGFIHSTKASRAAHGVCLAGTATSRVLSPSDIF